VEFLVDTKAELFELMVRSDLHVLGALLEEDRAALCGPQYAHQPAAPRARGRSRAKWCSADRRWPSPGHGSAPRATTSRCCPARRRIRGLAGRSKPAAPQAGEARSWRQSTDSGRGQTTQLS